jgi:hypothetical protein
MKQEKIIEKMLDFHLILWDNRVSAIPLVFTTKQKENTMSNVIAPTVGSQFTTQRAGIVGIVQEVVLNKTGTYRVRLDVNGDTRWTTVK